MAHKKAAWSAKNLRDSKPKYRGVKIFGWQQVVAWNIIIRQNGNKYEAWKNTYIWKDFSIHASISWVVEFSKKNKLRFDGRRYLKTVVHVAPAVIADKKEVTKSPAVIADKKEVTKSPAKKVVEKKAEVKKAPAKKVVEKKAPAKKPVAKKPVVRKTSK
jgi:large subunit ribosomal protein L27